MKPYKIQGYERKRTKTGRSFCGLKTGGKQIMEKSYKSRFPPSPNTDNVIISADKFV